MQAKSTRSAIVDRFLSQRIVVILWLLWALAVLLVYYKQLWRLFTAGPVAWAKDNYSLVLVKRYLQLALPGPFLIEALARAGGAVFGAVAVLAASQVLGAGVCRLLGWRPANRGEAVLYRTALGLGAISYLSLGLAVLGLYHAGNVLILISAALLGGAVWALHSRDRFSLSLRQIKAPFKLFSTEHVPLQDRVGQVIVALALLIAFIGALAPETEGDALWYHLWLPRVWLQQGRPVDIVVEYISLYPLTWELIFGAGLAWGGPIAAKLLHFVCLPLTGLLVYQLANRFLPRVSPWLATALFVTIPTVLWEATTAYIDLALTFHIGLVIYALLHYIEGRHRQWLVLAVLNLGLALATKHLALFALALLVSGLALRLWLEERNLRRALAPAILLGGLSLLFPLPWYLRAWVASGNPFFPDLYHIFGAFPPERWSDITEYGLTNFKNHFGDPRTPLNLLLLPWNMTIHAARYGGNLGPLFLLLLPALLLRRRNRIIPWLLAFVILYLALWASPVSSFQMRFVLPVTPLLAVLAAEAFSRLTELHLRRPRYQVVASGGAALLLLLNLPPFTSLHEHDRALGNGWLTHVVHEAPLNVVLGSESQADYLARKVPSYPAWQYINTHLPPEARILSYSGGDQFYSDRSRVPDIFTGTVAITRAEQGQEQQLIRELKRLGISHILFDKRKFEAEWWDKLAIAEPAVIGRWYELMYEDGRFALYRLRWEDLKLAPVEDSVTGETAGLRLSPNPTPASVPSARLPLLLGLVFTAGTVILKGRAAILARFQPRLARLAYLRDLLRELVVRDMKLRYKRSVLGLAWSLLNPLAQLLVFYLIFSLVLPLDIPNYPVFLFAGLLVWTWFQSSLFSATGVILENPDLIRRPGFPVAALPVVTVITHLIHFLLALPILLVFLLLSHIPLTGAMPLLPLVITLQFVFTLSLAYLVAAVHVTFRDTQYLLGILLLLGFYLSPIFYKASVIPARFQFIYHLNPMVDLIQAYRAILIQGELPSYLPLFLLGVVSIGLLGAGYWIFVRASYRFVEEL